MKVAILKIYNDQKLYQAMGKRGRKVVKEQFCRAGLADKFESALLELYKNTSV